MRILSVWLPSWPTLRLRRIADAEPARSSSAQAAGETKPLATVETVRGQRCLAAVCPDAQVLGLRVGQPLAEARAMCPRLEVVDADRQADCAALAALARWCERYTPLAAVDPSDGLWLDITGCAHLFGSETELAQDLAARLDRSALACRLAVAGTPGAAWALARSATARSAISLLPPGQERQALSVLPVALLRIEARTVAGLRRVGLKTIGELARLPRSDLSARFGPLPLLRLDQAYGHAPEAIAWPRQPAPWAERLAFVEPIGTPQDLARGLEVLAKDLCKRLEAAQRGSRRLLVGFFRTDGERPCIAVSTALPVRDAAYMSKLLCQKLDTVDPGFGIELMVLEALETAPLRAPQATIADLAKPQQPPLAATVDQLANRLGEDRLWRTAPRASHVPERAVRHLPPLDKPPVWEADPAVQRPVRLFRRPEPIEATAPVPDDPPLLFRWRGALHRVRAASGPERIAAEWWHHPPDNTGPDNPGPDNTRPDNTGPDHTLPDQTRREIDLVRDYYRVEDSAGARFWIFRTGLHGSDHAPRWFLHGLFG